MISQIELFKQSKKLESDEIATAVEKKEDEALQFGALKYQMMYLPEKARLQEMARIGQLEQRLGRLENLIGITDEKFSAFSQVSVNLFLNQIFYFSLIEALWFKL